MIFINDNNTLGSKVFTGQLAQTIRPVLAQCLSEEALEDFDLGLLQDILHLGDLSAADFNVVFDVICGEQDLDKYWQQILIKYMQVDVRCRDCF